MRAAERNAGLGEALTTAVARAYHKLLAAKDEWEVARLFAAPEFQQAWRANSKAPISSISISARGRSRASTRQAGE